MKIPAVSNLANMITASWKLWHAAVWWVASHTDLCHRIFQLLKVFNFWNYFFFLANRKSKEEKGQNIDYTDESLKWKQPKLNSKHTEGTNLLFRIFLGLVLL